MSPRGNWVYGITEDGEMYCFSTTSGKLEHVLKVKEMFGCCWFWKGFSGSWGCGCGASSSCQYLVYMEWRWKIEFMETINVVSWFWVFLSGFSRDLDSEFWFLVMCWATRCGQDCRGKGDRGCPKTGNSPQGHFGILEWRTSVRAGVWASV